MSLPCALIQAKDRKEAAEKILLIGNQYGKMTNRSLQDLLVENDLDFAERQNELELPSTGLDFFSDGTFEPTAADEQGRLEKKNPVTCPQCDHELVP